MILLVVIVPASLPAQDPTPCGTPDTDPAEYEAILQMVAEHQSTPASSAQYEIPIWLYIVRDDNGYFFLESGITPKKLIEEVNEHYSNTTYPARLHFNLCGVTFIDESDWTDLNLDDDGTERNQLTSHAQSINPEYSDGFLTVFWVSNIRINGGTTLGYAGDPSPTSRSSVIIASAGAANLAHEIGHYFGLLHTHAGGPNNQFVDPLKCSTTGDFLCDTHADPGPVAPSVQYCTTSPNCVITNCSILDPEGMPYNPDPSLTMSYYYSCSNRFSDEQYEIMINMFLHDDAYAFLRDNDIPTCQNLPNDRGNVVRACGSTPMAVDKIKLLEPTGQVCGYSGLATDNLGIYATYSCVFPSYAGNLSALPDKNYRKDLLNGVKTSDLVLINKQILGTEPLGDPFKLIAADANNSGSVTTFDLVEIRKAILGVTQSFSAGSWRYVPKLCFTDPLFDDGFNGDEDPLQAGVQPNPFNAVWTDPQGNTRYYFSSSTPNTDSWMDHVTVEPYASYADNPNAWSFWGIKVGDVNCDANLNFGDEPPLENSVFAVEPHDLLLAGDTFFVDILFDSVAAETSLAAWQVGIGVDPAALEILDASAVHFSGFDSDAYYYAPTVEHGELRVLWFDPLGDAVLLPEDRKMLRIRVRTLLPVADIGAALWLENDILPKYVYDDAGNEVNGVSLRLSVAGNGAIIPRQQLPAVASSIERLTVQPVPFRDEVIFKYMASSAGDVHFTLYDPLGRAVVSSATTCEKGSNTYFIKDAGRFQEGLYYYSVQAGASIFSGKIIKQ